MTKKSFLILIIPPLVFFFSGWIYSALVYYGEPLTEFFCFVSSFILSVALYVIEIIAFVFTKKFLAKKINDYQLLFMICGIAFILLFVSGGFSGFILKVAYSTENISVCNILIGFRASWNKNLCITHIARETGEELSCEKVSLEERASCYGTLAIKKGDPTICGKIRLEFSGSGGLPGGMIREMCYRYLAERKKDITICEKAKEASEDWCIKDEDGYSIVVSNYPLFNCYKIAREECCKKYGEYIKTDCYQQVAK